MADGWEDAGLLSSEDNGVPLELPRSHRWNVLENQMVARRPVVGAAVVVGVLGAIAIVGRRHHSSLTSFISSPVADYEQSGPFNCLQAPSSTAGSLSPGTGDGTTWRCDGGACILQQYKCDGTPNCADSSDESATYCSAASSSAVAPAASYSAQGSQASLQDSSTVSNPTPPPTPFPQSFAVASSATSSQASDAAVATSAPSEDANPLTTEAPSAQFQPAASASASSSTAADGSACSDRAGLNYHLDWKAEGRTFFNEWNYLLNDPNSGAAQYMPRDRAEAHQMTVGHDSHAILRSGPKGDNLKRLSVKMETQKKWTYFLMAMKFTHVPWGCGVWPALWTHSPDAAWPNGGELDILEYCNEITSRSSFHVGEVNKCVLDAKEVHKPGCPNFVDAEYNFTGHYDCVTDYPEHIGCAPNKLPLLSGEALANEPSVVAAEWTKDFLKIFRIPSPEIPSDLASDSPKPDSWDQWLVAYYPFAASERNKPGSCPNPAQLIKAQQIVLSLGFCGDWPSKVWVNSTCAERISPTIAGPTIHSQCEAVDPHNPMGETPGGPKDCCTQFIYDEGGKFGTEEYLQNNAYFNITWLKVFQAS